MEEAARSGRRHEPQFLFSAIKGVEFIVSVLNSLSRPSCLFSGTNACLAWLENCLACPLTKKVDAWPRLRSCRKDDGQGFKSCLVPVSYSISHEL